MGNPIKLLILEDNPVDAELMLAELHRAGLEVQCRTVSNRTEFLAALDQEPDLVFADFNLPQYDATLALHDARIRDPNLPFLIISGSIGEETAVELIKQGATDYLLKDRLSRLAPAVRQALKQRDLLRTQRQAEQDLHRMSREFQTILEGIPDSLSLIDRDFRIIWANHNSQHFYGRPGAEPGKEPDRPLLHQPQAPCAHCIVAECLRTGQTQDGTANSPDGRIWGIKAFALKDEAGLVTAAIKWASDITEKQNLRLENEKSSRLAAIGELAAGVAHEINNPNSVIQLNLKTVQSVIGETCNILETYRQEVGDFELGGMPFSVLRQELPQLVADALECSGRISRIVEDLKDFSRQGEPGEIELVELNDVVQTAARLVNASIQKATNRFELHFAPALPPVRGSFQRLEQVVVNLILNACQALTATDQAISLTTCHCPASCQVRLTVRDEGAGIRPQDLPLITEPFFTTRRRSGGTGLGLSVSQRIVEDHGGTLQFTTSPETGTLVTLSLPVQPEDTSA